VLLDLYAPQHPGQGPDVKSLNPNETFKAKLCSPRATAARAGEFVIDPAKTAGS
jgi:hypothetical protein